MIGYYNNWIIMKLLGDVTYAAEYENINITIIDGNVTNVSLIITTGDFGASDAYDTSCHSYYIIRFPLSTYTL